MNTPPVIGYAGTRPAFEFSAQGQDSRWQEWHVVDRRNGLVICECWPPRPHNLQDAIDSLNIECEACTVGLETVDLVDGEEVSEPCQVCGRLGNDVWISPLGKAELIAGELNALYPGMPGEVDPTTEMLCDAIVMFRIQGVGV